MGDPQGSILKVAFFLTASNGIFYIIAVLYLSSIALYCHVNINISTKLKCYIGKCRN